MDTTKTPAAPEAESTPADLTKADLTKAEIDTELADAELADADLDDDEDDDEFSDELAATREPSHVASAASAIVAAGLGVVALSGSWVAGIVSERAGVTGRLELTQAADVNAQIAAQFVQPWHATAVVNGIFAAIALIVAILVLALPALGSPQRTLPAWVRSVAWAAVALGAIGVLVFVLMYFDLLLAVPQAAAV
ncbi:hypothetical protein OG625_11465 [Streptomyces sp. NBC_01351]|uniref:hypothetical protein n=1 Tax=Streptomyces sp. NBC_01351 TaxID=2903833 RepID=UPI002E343FCE|nr:hypothetical protein [Streptomyces sp. NBC_01351]